MLTRCTRDFLPAILIACGLALGGSSSGGIWANLVVTLIALASLALLLVQRRHLPVSPGLIVLCLGIVALPLLQLLPLPPTVWTQLPGRSEIALGFSQSGLALPWLPIALDQDAALSSLNALTAPLAMLMVGSGASPFGRRLALQVVLGIAMISILLGIAQVWPGLDLSLRPYEVTNPDMAVGLFANRNHLATLLLAAIPIAAILTIRRAVAILLCMVLAGGVIVTRSDAGAALLLPVLAASLLFVRPLWRTSRVVWASFGVLALIAAAVVGWGVLQQQRGLTALGAEQRRPAIISTTLTAARDYLPFGAGAGSFRQIYPRYEDQAQTSQEFINHAHSDYAEVVLEYGVPGLLIAFATWLWFGRRVLAHPGGHGRAGAVIIGVILVHSLVDYPLRTAAIAMLAALAATMLDQSRQVGSPGKYREPGDGEESLRISL